MCYSAQIKADYQTYVRTFGAIIDIGEFARLYGNRLSGSKAKIPKALEAWFAHPRTAEERAVNASIETYNREQIARLEQELFKQTKRLADAERTLRTKATKKAADDQRIARAKIGQIKGWLADLKRTEPKDRDARIFPGHYAPVIVMEHGRRIVKPMRYQCRPAGKPAFYDTKFPGTYNARSDNLEGFWEGLFGHSHGVMVIEGFYENVSRHRIEGRDLAPGEKEENVVLEFLPEPRQDMLVACLWSRWSAPGEEDLLSFAAITDEPPAEVAAAGHDRCVIPIKPEHVDAWLNPDPGDLATLYAILDDRARPYYEHRMAA
ncbi:MAG: SOS response-associated peptidase family protein [Mizugakiibacter sp.]|uniref:SOS response-associated peptidase family protein n=1 Tax=Mizugakiibacter sp. TaxID=1972610 RepID=UPI00321138F7